MAGAPFGGEQLDLAETPPPGAVQVGDLFVTFFAQPGDEVILPSHVACQSTETAEGLQVDVVATGAVKLTVPGAYARAYLLTAAERHALPLSAADQGTTILLSAADLAEGRARVLLTR
jgi:hypothetical protein